jgi:cytoskeletal protein RodZ
MPRGIFVRGYLRAYAREVGLDPGAVLEQYLAETGEAPPPLPEAPPPAVSKPVDAILLHTHAEIEPAATSLGSIAAALALAAFALGIVAFLSMRDAPPRPTAIDDARPTTGLVPDAPQPPDVPVATTGAETAAGAQEITVTIFPTADCWVEAIADDETRLYRLMRSGERESVTAERSVTLRVGDPDAFAFAVNGQPGRALGSARTPITVRLTPANYQQYIEPSR